LGLEGLGAWVREARSNAWSERPLGELAGVVALSVRGAKGRWGAGGRLARSVRGANGRWGALALGTLGGWALGALKKRATPDAANPTFAASARPRSGLFLPGKANPPRDHRTGRRKRDLPHTARKNPTRRNGCQRKSDLRHLASHASHAPQRQSATAAVRSAHRQSEPPASSPSGRSLHASTERQRAPSAVRASRRPTYTRPQPPAR
jgi:hypothetical protein